MGQYRPTGNGMAKRHATASMHLKENEYYRTVCSEDLDQTGDSSQQITKEKIQDPTREAS